MNGFLKQSSSQVEIDFFFYLFKVPYETRTNLLLPVFFYKHKNHSYCSVNSNFETTLIIEKILIWRKITIKVNKIMPIIPISHKTLILINSSKKCKIQKKNLFNFEFYTGRAFYWCHSHSSTMNVSIDQNCLNQKNPVEYIVPPPTNGVGTKNYPVHSVASTSSSTPSTV